VKTSIRSPLAVNEGRLVARHAQRHRASATALGTAHSQGPGGLPVIELMHAALRALAALRRRTALDGPRMGRIARARRW
jgi:hypothetical protein